MSCNDLVETQTAYDIHSDAIALGYENMQTLCASLPEVLAKHMASTVNSKRERGKRLAHYYSWLLRHPRYLVGQKRGALEALIAVGRKYGLSAVGAYAASNVAGPQSAYGYDDVAKGEFVFPRDHGPHYNIRQEWWFVVGNYWTSEDAKGPPLSMVFVIKRRATVPLYWRSKASSAVDNDVVEVITTLTLPDGTRIAPPAFVVAGSSSLVQMQAHPFRVGVGKFSMQASKGRSVFPLRLQWDDIRTGVKLDLVLNADKPLFLQGWDGCAPCVSGVGYRYYSWSRLSTRGKVLVPLDDKNKPHEFDVAGVSWMDHQWGARMAPFGYFNSSMLQAFANLQKPLDFNRWNWFLMQFTYKNKPYELTAVLLPAPDPREAYKKWVSLSHAQLVLNEKDRKSQRAATRDLDDPQVMVTKIVKGPHGTLYPMGWRFKFEQDEFPVVIDMVPTYENQFFIDGLGLETHEGACVVSGRDLHGVGFAEMVGYTSIEDKTKIMLSQIHPTLTRHYREFLPYKPTIQLKLLSATQLLVPIVLLVLITVLVVKKVKAGRGV